MSLLYGVPVRVTPKHYKAYFSSLRDQLDALKESSTVYVGNVAFTTPEERVYDFFSRCGDVEHVIMGVNRFDLSPCGFCFVIFKTHEEAQNAVDFLSGLKLDGQTIRIEMDWGFSDGRQYGRASNGGQMRHFINDIKKSGDTEDVRRGESRYGRGGRNERPFNGDRNQRGDDHGRGYSGRYDDRKRDRDGRNNSYENRREGDRDDKRRRMDY